MKSILTDYTTYNLWANKQIVHKLQTLDEAQVRQSFTGSFPSLHQINCHLWNAQSIWLQRLLLHEHISIESPDSNITSIEAAYEGLLLSSYQLIDFVQKQLDDKAFSHEVIYKNMNGELCKNTVYDCIHHCINHSTFHRGQTINFLRALGVTKIPTGIL
jgi:Uncharacterized protein conserved in bacteria